MLYDIKKLPNLPVILATWYDGFSFTEHGKQYVQKLHALLDAQNSPAFYVVDLSQPSSLGFEELLTAANSGARGLGASFHHAMNCGTLIVSSDPLVLSMAPGMNSEIYGNVNMKIFDTLDEALAYVRRQM